MTGYEVEKLASLVEDNPFEAIYDYTDDLGSNGFDLKCFIGVLFDEIEGEKSLYLQRIFYIEFDSRIAESYSSLKDVCFEI